MSILQRFAELFQQKVSASLESAEDPAQALDLSYQKQLDTLQEVRREVLNVLAAEKQLGLRAQAMRDQQAKLRATAQTALQQGREDLAKEALTRAQLVQGQLTGLEEQIAQVRAQEQKLSDTGQKLRVKVEAFRQQRTALSAQYGAARASTKAGEAVTGLSEEFANATLMADRAKDKIERMQARAQALGELIDTGALEAGGTGTEDLERQLGVKVLDAGVEAEMLEMKRSLGIAAPAQAPQLGSGTFVVRIQGEDQYRVPLTARDTLEGYDRDLVAAIGAADEARFKAALQGLVTYVRTSGTRVAATDAPPSEAVIPADDTRLDEAKTLLGPDGFIPDRLAPSAPRR